MLRCQIHVFNPPDITFNPTQRVRGIIKYTVYEEMFLKRIVVSLKGNGVLNTEAIARRRFKEDYIDIDKIVQEDLKGFTLGVGDYEAEFDFELPANIPGSIKTQKETARHKVECQIQYYIRIKFVRGYLKADKWFKKIITVNPFLEPSLPLVPVTIQKFKNMDGYLYTGCVQITAAVENPVFYRGDTIMVHYKLRNFTNTCLDRVVISLIEVQIFKPNRPFINARSYNEVDDTTITIEDIPLAENRSDTAVIVVPNNICTSLHSTLVMREYFVKLIVQLPDPNEDIVLKIPVEIGVRSSIENITDNSVEMPNGNRNLMYPFPPPSYWETIGEVPLIMEETEENAR